MSHHCEDRGTPRVSVCSCPVDVGAGANAVPFALCENSESHRSAADSDILPVSLSLSHFSLADLIVFVSEGKGR